MRVILASDHAGYELKSKLIAFLKEKDYEVEDMGPYELNPIDDYPDFIIPAAQKVVSESALGIVIGYSGQGEALAANKVRGVRAVLYNGGPKEVLTLTREHNNANILSLGAHFLSEKEAQEAVNLWINTEFSNEDRHVRRLKKVSEFEEK